jgi:hypothetical protein
MSGTAIAPAMRGLLQGLVDYAGLFPPAGLAMPTAVANYAAYHASADAWALGRFVVTASRLAEFEEAASSLAPPASHRPWTVSLLVVRAEECALAPDFNARWGGRVIIDAIEGKASTPAEVRALVAARPASMELFVELAVGPELRACLAEVRRGGAEAKLRAGGVTADAFPSVDDVVTFLRACFEAGVPFKATAGLHHPVRGSYRLTYAPGSESALMHGYLNVLVAAEVIAGGGSDDDARRVLLAESADDLVVSEERIAWAGVTASREPGVGRQSLRGVGSCSFREPVDELAALGVTA